MLNYPADLVLSIGRCRHLPAPTGYRVSAEATFNGHRLQLQPLPLVAAVDFSTELVWRTERRCLNWHRQQRTSLKLQLFACGDDKQTSFRQPIGYVVLSVRDACAPVALEWRKLLGCAVVSRLEPPSVQVSLTSIDLPEKLSGVLCPRRAAIAPARTIQNTTSKTVSIDTKPSVSPVSSQPVHPVFEMKSVHSCVLIIHRLIDPHLLFSGNSCLDHKFHFNANFMNCECATEEFFVENATNFPAQKFEVCLSCSPSYFTLFFQQIGVLEVRIFCQKTLLGVCYVPVSDFCSAPTFLSSKSDVIRGEFIVSAPQRSDASSASCRLLLSVKVENTGQSQLSSSETDGANEHTTDTTPAVVPDGVAESRTLPEEVEVAIETAAVDNAADPARDLNTFNPTACKHYRFVLDIQSLTLDSQISSDSVCIRFSYPYFGSSCERSIGPLELNSCPCLVPLNVAYEYNFVAPADWLSLTLQRFPLCVKLVDSRSEAVIATSYLALHHAFFDTNLSDTTAKVKSSNPKCMSTDFTSDDKTVMGKMDAVLSLDDLGVSDVSWTMPDDLSASFGDINLISNGKTGAIEAFDDVPTEQSPQLYLQDWQSEQQRMFAEKLKQKEIEHVRALNEEWKRCDAGRELQFQQRMRSVSLLEQKLKGGLEDLELQRRQLLVQQRRVEAMRSQTCRSVDDLACQFRTMSNNLSVQTNRKVQTAESALARVCDQVQHLQRRILQVTSDRENRTASLQRQLDAAVESKLYYKRRWADMASQFERLKEAQTTADSARSDYVRLTASEASTSDNEDGLSPPRSCSPASQWCQADNSSGQGHSTRLGNDRPNITLKQSVTAVKRESIGLGSVRHVRTASPSNSHSSGYRTSTSPLAEPLISSFDGFGSRKQRLAQLRDERSALLRTGLYTEQDQVVRLLSDIIHKLES